MTVHCENAVPYWGKEKKSNLFLKFPPASFNWDFEFLLKWMQVSIESVKEGDKALIYLW